MSIFSGLFNLGIGAGSWLGGVVIEGAGIGAVGFVGGALALAGLAAYLAGAGVTRRTRRKRRDR